MVEWKNVTPEDLGSSHGGGTFDFQWSESWRKIVGKLSENSAECQCPRNIPSSSSELVELTLSACRKSVTSPWYLSTASSGQAGGVFRQLFFTVYVLLCLQRCWTVLKGKHIIIIYAVSFPILGKNNPAKVGRSLSYITIFSRRPVVMWPIFRLVGNIGAHFGGWAGGGEPLRRLWRYAKFTRAIM